MRRGRSLRRHAFLIGLVVILSPLALIMVTSGLESVFADRTLERTSGAARDVAAALQSEGLEEARSAAKSAAERHHQRIRILGPTDETLVDENRLIGESATFVIGDVFYGPERKLVLEKLDRDLGAPASRPELLEARRSGSGSTCHFVIAGNLFVCTAAQHVARSESGALTVVAEGSSRRALQALYEYRRQMAKLILFSGALAIALAWWTLRSFVSPVEALRNELLSRAREAAPAHVSMPSSRRSFGSAQELSDLTAAFNTVLTALGDRTRANEVFLQDLAHEFKNPVAAIRACAERLAEPGPLDDSRRARLADALTQSSIRLDALVTQFLELARAEAGLPNEQRSPVRIDTLLENLVEALRRDVRHEQVRFVLSLEHPLEVPAVADRLEMALRNLLSNAGSFAGEAGWVRVGARTLDGGVELTIADSGPGIPAEHLPKLFDRFFTRRGDKHGTGLGLALTRAVVEAHRGRIEVRSPPGEGATFVLWLPFTDVSHDSR